MNNTTINSILAMPNGSLLDAIQGTIVEVYPAKTVKGNKTVQDAKIKDGTGAMIKLVIWDHPDCSTYKGRDVIIQSGPKGGLKVQLDTYRQPNVNTISVSKTATFQFLEVHVAQTGGLNVANNPSVPNQGVAPRLGTGGSNPSTIVVNGAKVGMSLNNACLFLTSTGEPYSSDRVFQIASELIRLSNRMEQGELAPEGLIATEKEEESAPF